MPGLRQSCDGDAHTRQLTRAGSNDGPAFQRERSKQLHRARQRNDALYVGNFASLHFTIFRFVIHIG